MAASLLAPSYFAGTAMTQRPMAAAADIDPDTAIVPVDELAAQALEVQAEDMALEDTLYALQKAFQGGQLDATTYLRQVCLVWSPCCTYLRQVCLVSWIASDGVDAAAVQMPQPSGADMRLREARRGLAEASWVSSSALAGLPLPAEPKLGPVQISRFCRIETVTSA